MVAGKTIKKKKSNKKHPTPQKEAKKWQLKKLNNLLKNIKYYWIWQEMSSLNLSSWLFPVAEAENMKVVLFIIIQELSTVGKINTEPRQRQRLLNIKK